MDKSKSKNKEKPFAENDNGKSWSSESRGRSSEVMGEYMDDAKRQGSHLKQEVEQKASQVKEKTEGKIVSVLKQNKEAATGEIRSFIQVLRDTSEKLKKEDHITVAEYSEKLADGLERMNESIRQRDVKETFHNVEDFAKRQPWLFVGGAVAGGFALSRFLKSSGQKQSLERSSYGKEFDSDESERSERIEPIETSSVSGVGAERQGGLGAADFEMEGDEFTRSFKSALDEDREGM